MEIVKFNDLTWFNILCIWLLMSEGHSRHSQPPHLEGNCDTESVMDLGETLHLSSHKYTGPLSNVKIAKVMYCSGS